MREALPAKSPGRFAPAHPELSAQIAFARAVQSLPRTAEKRIAMRASDCSFCGIPALPLEVRGRVMLNARQREQCRAIAAALDAGDQRPWLKAGAELVSRSEGLDLGHMRAHVIAGGGGGRARVEGGRGSESEWFKTSGGPPRVETEFHDLDHWATDDDQDGDGDDGDEVETVPCQVCNGAGKDVTGRVCQACNGTGVAPDDDDREDDDDDGEFKED